MATGLGMVHVLRRTRVKYSGCSETGKLVRRPSRKCNVHELRGGAVKVRSAAERGVRAQQAGRCHQTTRTMRMVDAQSTPR